MTWVKRDERPLTESPGKSGSFHPEDLAAELTEAAFLVALRHRVGTDWLDRKVELWHAITRPISAWEQHSHRLRSE